MPPWLVTLQVAEAWHVPPWEIEGRRGVRKWIKRWNAYQEQIKKSKDLDKKHAERLSKNR